MDLDESATLAPDCGIPIPEQDDPLSAPFWAAANKGQLVIQRCNGCRAFFHPPVAVCPECLMDDLAFKEVSGDGRVYSWAIVHDSRIAAFGSQIPYIVASVELDDAPDILLTSNMPGSRPMDIRSDLPVTVTFQKIAEGIALPQFRSVDVKEG